MKIGKTEVKMEAMKEIYLDNAATTQADPLVIEVMERVLREDYGNPSSLHKKGVQAEKYVRGAAEYIAKTLHVSPKEIVFTSGGTEGNNTALFGAARANRRFGNRILTSMVEHPSVSNVMNALSEDGFLVGKLPVDKEGRLLTEALSQAADEETILFSLMLVNNEIGTIEPVGEAVRILREKAPNAIVHVDAIQAYGKIPLEPEKLDIDLLSVSGHKLFGPKGSGFLYVREKTRLRPLLFGGGQQQNLRSGTENVPAIAGLKKAAELAFTDAKEKREGLYRLRDRFVEAVTSIEGVSVNGGRTRETAAPHIVSVSTKGVRAEVLLHALEEEGIYVSAGSACSSHKKNISPTLNAIGLPKDLLEETVRFSFSYKTTAEELETAADALRRLVPSLRKYTRR